MNICACLYNYKSFGVMIKLIVLVILALVVASSGEKKCDVNELYLYVNQKN